ncbi:hypothetical protein MLD38_032473 [Melastoma candidum]|uniref:Uncharacterized protein n=1 Tax=Melastoma candidum TaxID=119954 RepID=A0ACB9M5J2_9MYRT|nr:hypothetical protein MLD38_032473 [Melastoma candidum]
MHAAAAAVALAPATTSTITRPHPISQPQHQPDQPHRQLHLALPPSKTPKFPSISLTVERAPQTLVNPTGDGGRSSCSSDEFREKVLFLDSLGLDSLSLVADHPDLLPSVSLPSLRSTVDLLIHSSGLSSIDLRRVFGMCPDLLALPASFIRPVLTFLLREAEIESVPSLRAAIVRRPRLLASSVEQRLRPTLYFLQSIGVTDVRKHTNLLSCSVEDKFIPRMEYFREVGFSERDTRAMFRRFPQLFCYSVKDNLEVKLNYFVVEMGRELRELRDFPQYFSFSLENRIKPRHRACLEQKVCLRLPVMLKSSEEEFRRRLDVCCGPSMPRPTSPLFCTDHLGTLM